MIEDIKAENIVFLLGAGASYEAGIPVSYDMVTYVESYVKEKKKWKTYKDLYYYLKSSIEYSKGIFGDFNYTFNIEDLLVVLEALEQRDKNIMYPHISSWNMRLLEFAGDNFINISNFKNLIKEQISEWVKPKEGYDKANYYDGFIKLSNEIAHTIKVFTLNYDLCFERTVERSKEELTLELGFSNRIWNYKNFDSINVTTTTFALYKLHGSVNWIKDDEGNLRLKDDPVKDAELIFGVPYKLTSNDPYFFYATEFRKSLFDDATRLIICIGYSFYDDYLNQFIRQAMRDNEDVKLYCVTYIRESIREEGITDKQKELSQILECNEDKIEVYPLGAKKFLQEEMSVEKLSPFISSSGPFGN